MKVCGRCREAKPLDAYSPSRRYRGNSLCNTCMNERTQEYQRRNKEQQAKNVVRAKTKNFVPRSNTCQRCGAIGAQFHHRSYNKPDSYRDIEFLCEPCHKREHE